MSLHSCVDLTTREDFITRYHFHNTGQNSFTMPIVFMSEVTDVCWNTNCSSNKPSKINYARNHNKSVSIKDGFQAGTFESLFSFPALFLWSQFMWKLFPSDQGLTRHWARQISPNQWDASILKHKKWDPGGSLVFLQTLMDNWNQPVLQWNHKPSQGLHIYLAQDPWNSRVAVPLPAVLEHVSTLAGDTRVPTVLQDKTLHFQSKKRTRFQWFLCSSILILKFCLIAICLVTISIWIAFRWIEYMSVTQILIWTL